ncbi:MAG: GNAT family N-acetyltransferase [Verrucomicrobia bacterium]|nr:MAG: GNAT family N-acetyltransferase [Verrucomicrobiota bacterium]
MISLRPITPEDTAFLARVYASSRAEELAPTGWSDEQKEIFCRKQFDAQTAYYSVNYPGASFQVIERDGVPIGRLYVVRWEKEIRIVDITVLPEFRGGGIGTELLRDLRDEARSAGKSLTIHVERFNRALQLYQRLGFKQIEDKGVYLLMEWRGNGTSHEGHKGHEGK